MADLERTLGALYRRIMLMVGRGTLAMTDDGTGQERMQVQLLDGETRDASDRVQQYGISSHPPAGSHVLVVNVGGQRDHPIIIGADDPTTRPTGLAEGEVMLWSAHGQRTHFKQDGGAEITTAEGHTIRLLPGSIAEIECQQITVKASSKARFETPTLECTGDIKDQCDGGGMSMLGMRDDYNAHVHGGSPPPTPPMAP